MLVATFQTAWMSSKISYLQSSSLDFTLFLAKHLGLSDLPITRAGSFVTNHVTTQCNC